MKNRGLKTMETSIREAQEKVLAIFSKIKSSFALSGGTALELYYLGHRFSRDLDFFSPNYSSSEVEKVITALSLGLKQPIKLENQFTLSTHAKVSFYSVKIKGSSSPLKIDFIEDVLFKNPKIKKFAGVPVYAVLQIYLQKITAITGTNLSSNSIGREAISGRQEIRDIIDLYYLSKKIKALHLYLPSIPRVYQRGLIQWHHTFSRQDFKLGFLDYVIYDKTLDSSQVINYLDSEIGRFIKEELA